MSDEVWELLDRYLSGETSAEEARRVEAWLAEDPEHWAQLAALRDAIANAALSDDAVEQAKAEVWARLHGEVGGAGDLAGRTRGRQLGGAARGFELPVRSRRLRAVQLAAALVLTLLGGTAIATLVIRWHGSAPVETMRVATTARGQRAAFRLPDGTRVMLGVASTLRYPAAFGEGAGRTLSLDGEAYFDVVHDESRPFVVRAGGVVATDLGTEFTVRAYPDDRRARVVVRSGRVAIRGAGSPPATERVVAPGQLGRVRAGAAPTVETADTAAYFAWTQGRLVIDRTPLRDALPELGRWFNLEFRLADSALGDVPLTATLTTQPTPEVLNNLAASLGMRARRDGQRVTLYAADSVPVR